MLRSNMLLGRVLLSAFVAVAPGSARAQQGSPDNIRRVANRVAPPYPELARAMKVKGVVKLEASVAPNGTVNSIKVVGGHPVLVQAAERAVQKWRWEPAARESKELIELRFNPE